MAVTAAMAFAFNQVASSALFGDGEKPGILARRLTQKRMRLLAEALDATAIHLENMSMTQYAQIWCMR